MCIKFSTWYSVLITAFADDCNFECKVLCDVHNSVYIFLQDV